MFNFNRTLIYLKGLTPLSPNPNPLLHHCPSLFSLHFYTDTLDSTSFIASYLIHNFSFSLQFASKFCSTHRLRFKITQKLDYVLNFFKNHNFSDSQLCNMIAKEAVKIFQKLDQRSVKSYDALSKVILRRGRYMMTNRIYNEMLREGIEPTRHTYNILLWVDEDESLFVEMKEKNIILKNCILPINTSCSIW
ncbi:unnamed protein product [Vicia faba]|uniref:Pentatricopeptide repeat-containing protein n=1 Tax=Vicia faba TaxID=3906 RepID=A0AAV0ZMZ7_VICFA|nr:unnamed protein product [Vicia faba]